MTLSEQQKRICEQVLNAFETGSARGNYSNISIFNDGPNHIRQVTYGRSQTTEYGNLRELVEMYSKAEGTHSAALRPYVGSIGRIPLVDNDNFKNLLRAAGKDPVMHRTQDEFFDRRYFQKAKKWAEDNGFQKALSMLVIYDSIVHSGSILDFLRARFQATPPVRGGSEEEWIRQYVDTRHDWLATHSTKILRKTIYRTNTFKREIERGNWDLSQVPINANGVPITGENFAPAAPAATEPVAKSDTPPTIEVAAPSSLEQVRDNDLHINLRDLGLSEYRRLAKQIQECLITLGYLDPPADGAFGPVSQHALELLQEHDPAPDTEVLNASLANLLLNSDPFRFLPVRLDRGDLACRIFDYMGKNKYYFARLPGHLNIVYLEGANENGSPNDDQPNRFNDRRMVLGIENERPVILGNWEATTEPGKYWTEHPMNPRGAARIAFGQYNAWSIGFHHRNEPALRHEALVQVGEIRVHRDRNKDYGRDGDLIDIGSGFAINQHWGYDRPANDLGRSSAGCLVGRTTAGHRQFMNLIKSDERYQNNHSYKFLTTIIAGDKLSAAGS